ncbi:glycosyltransferase [Marinicrinis sediminis]|uniref:Glycosyltransferase n=1 Tax=Marinicrinis sediminis TaxID=1652465 RepID=A0ABW5RE17_9BACL
MLGHLVPVLGLGRELAQKGHHVSVAAPLPFQKLIEQLGLHFIPVTRGKYPHHFLQETLDEMDEVLAAHRVDLMICDSALSAPAYYAEKHGIPWVSYQTALYWPDSSLPGDARTNARLREQYRQKLNQLRQHYGLPLLHDDLRSRGDLAGYSPDLHLVMVLPALIPRSIPLPESFQVVGPCGLAEEVETKAASLPTQPQHAHLFVCTTSADKPGYREKTDHYLTAVVNAFPDPVMQITILDNPPDGLKHAVADKTPSHIRYAGTALRHHQVLPTADVMVTHGGCGTIQKGVLYQIPMLVISLGLDHTLLADHCEQLGLIRQIKPHELNPETIRQRIKELHQDADIRHRLKQVSSDHGIQQANQYAAEQIENKWMRG